MAENDLETANRLLMDLPSGNAKWQSSTFLAQEYVKKSISEAIDWANRFPKEDKRLRETILGQVGAKLARKDIQATASWVEKMIAEPASQRVMDNLLTQWVAESPQDASVWVADLEDSENQTYAMKQLPPDGHWWIQLRPQNGSTVSHHQKVLIRSLENL